MAAEQQNDAEVPKRSRHSLPCPTVHCDAAAPHVEPPLCPANLTPYLPTHTRLDVHPSRAGTAGQACEGALGHAGSEPGAQIEPVALLVLVLQPQILPEGF